MKQAIQAGRLGARADSTSSAHGIASIASRPIRPIAVLRRRFEARAQAGAASSGPYDPSDAAANKLSAQKWIQQWKQNVMKPVRVASGPIAAGGGVGGGGNIRDGGSGGNGGSGGGSPQGGDGRLDPGLAAVLLAAGRTIDSFPAEFAAAMASGKVTVDILKRYLDLEANVLLKMVWGIEGFRERLLADPSFPIKVGIEVGIGICTKLTAENAKRQENFWKEIDFVGANVAMAILADFMLTWLPAPTLSYAVKPKSTNMLMAAFAGCPDNAFQKVQPGMQPFTVTQRLGAILRNGLKLMGVGFCASLMGVGFTNGITMLRSAMDPNFLPVNAPQDLISTSAAYGLYMSVSSNLRYQVVAGIIEERGIETIFKGQHSLCTLLSFIVRTSNTFVGSLLWVDFVRLLGMQSASSH